MNFVLRHSELIFLSQSKNIRAEKSCMTFSILMETEKTYIKFTDKIHVTFWPDPVLSNVNKA